MIPDYEEVSPTVIIVTHAKETVVTISDGRVSLKTDGDVELQNPNAIIETPDAE